MSRAALTLLVLGLCAVAAAYGATLLGLATPLAPWWLAAGTTASLAGLALLGAARRGRRTPTLVAATVAASASLAVGFFVPLAMPSPDAATPLLLGLPRPTTILLLGAGLVPLVLLPVAYGVAFEREVLSPEDLASFRARLVDGGEARADEGTAP